jgi:hypothetical protein
MTIVLNCSIEPDPSTSQFLTEMRRRLQSYSIGLEIKVLPKHVA